jgi:type IV pilus assembly protein PilA
MKKMNNKGFSLVELIVVVAIMAVLMAVLVPTLIRNVEKTRVQKDKSAIAEIHHAAELALADEDFLTVTAYKTKATVDATSGALTVHTIFCANEPTDASTNVNEKFAAEVAATVGKTVKLTSKMKEDVDIRFAYVNTAEGKVVFTVKSTKAKEEFYIDSTGENAGTYVEPTT